MLDFLIVGLLEIPKILRIYSSTLCFKDALEEAINKLMNISIIIT